MDKQELDRLGGLECAAGRVMAHRSGYTTQGRQRIGADMFEVRLPVS